MQTRILTGSLPFTDRTDWLYPSADIGTLDWPFRLGAGDVEDALRMMDPCLNGYRTCIQAGGAIGIWPLRLIKTFDRVITFEAEPVNFQCLAHNVADVQVEHALDIWHAALGNDHEKVHMVLDRAGHCGAHQVRPGGDIDTVCIDDLNLSDVDLIYLDIEGSELAALKGAHDTIARCQPVIGFEDTGLGESPRHWLGSIGYRLIGKPQKKDRLYAPAAP